MSPIIKTKCLSSTKEVQFVDAKIIVNLCSHMKAVHYYSNSDIHSSGEVKTTDIPDDVRDAGGFSSSLTVLKGTRTMLIRNIYTSHELVNGAMGYVDSFDLSVDDPMLM